MKTCSKCKLELPIEENFKPYTKNTCYKCYVAIRKSYFLKNKEHLYKLRTISRKKYRINNIQYKLTEKYRDKLKKFFKYKNDSIHNEFFDCSLKELKQHLESKFKDGMTWENKGYKGWHIDHILPYTYFDLTDPIQLKQCCHFSNLQPLWSLENIAKSNKIQYETKKN